MPNPKIIGLVKLDIPFARRIDGVSSERVAHVGFDTDGQAWGLVSRLTNLGDGVGRLDYKRWIRCDALPFVEDERLVEGGGWTARYVTGVGG